MACVHQWKGVSTQKACTPPSANSREAVTDDWPWQSPAPRANTSVGDVSRPSTPYWDKSEFHVTLSLMNSSTIPMRWLNGRPSKRSFGFFV